MTISLKDIKAPIQKELDSFEESFKESVKSTVPLLDKVMYYIVKRKGKQMRPMFVFLCAKLIGEVEESTFRAASLVELLHTATLVHDDVVDDSNKRRGFFSVNALWKNKIAVLVGDYLLSRGLLLAVDNEDFQALKIISKAVKEMSEGELLQIQKSRLLNLEEEVYFEIIRQKTASLISAACAAGMASVTDDAHQIKQAALLGEKIGISFQIKDDLFDFGTEDIGKPTGIDIKEKKLSLPLIYAINKAEKKQRKWLINTIKKHNEDKEKVAEIISYVWKSGGIEYATKAMYRYRQEAFDILDTFPDTAAKKSLRMLIEYVTERKK